MWIWKAVGKRANAFNIVQPVCTGHTLRAVTFMKMDQISMIVLWCVNMPSTGKTFRIAGVVRRLMGMWVCSTQGTSVTLELRQHMGPWVQLLISLHYTQRILRVEKQYGTESPRCVRVPSDHDAEKRMLRARSHVEQPGGRWNPTLWHCGCHGNRVREIRDYWGYKGFQVRCRCEVA